MQQKPPFLGQVLNMSNDDYHAAPGWSSSHVKTFAEGALEFVEKYISPPEPLDPDEEAPDLSDQWKEDSDLILGSAIHLAILQPDLLSQETVVMPGLDFRTKNGRATRDEILAHHHPRKLVLTHQQNLMVLRIRDAVYADPVAKRLFDNGIAETPTFARDPETGELIKCMPDFESYRMGALIDVKSTRDASESGFGREVENLRYNFQPPWYFDVLEADRGEAPPNWIWLAIEKRARPRIGIYFEHPDDVKESRQIMRGHFEAMLRLRDSGKWPTSYTDDQIRRRFRPAWAKRHAAA